MKRLAIFGCGDFLRWQSDALKRSAHVSVAKLYDPDRSRAARFAEALGGEVAEEPDAVFADPQIDVVALFVPPWIRKDLFFKAAASGKHVIATKPLGSTPEDCQEMAAAAASAGIKAGVIYSRTDDAFVETTKRVLDEGRFGRLALYRQDWIHAYPQWNNWATDPDKNGGPFMDAMIHNLNAACYLMGRPVESSTLFSDRLAHPDLRCADTEAMVVRYEGGVAHLFITWAADLATYGTAGNDREHIDLFYLVTDRGWRLTRERRDQQLCLVASRQGQEQVVPVAPLEQSVYDAFAAHLDGGLFPGVLADLDAASRDLTLVRAHAAELATVLS